jgi:hypothetical protein
MVSISPFGLPEPDSIQDLDYLPGEKGYLTTVSSALIGDNYNGTTVVIGTVPYFEGTHVPTARRIYCVWGASEAGSADASNYTNIDVRIGTITDYTAIGGLQTTTGYSAGDVIEKSAWYPVKGGQLIFVVITRTGTAHNFNGDNLCVGVDIVGERVA